MFSIIWSTTLRLAPFYLPQTHLDAVLRHTQCVLDYLSGVVFNLLTPTCHVMHRQFNIQQLYVLPTHCIYVFCIYLRTNSDLCHLQHKVTGFYNRDEKCLLRGTNWVFK